MQRFVSRALCVLAAFLGWIPISSAQTQTRPPQRTAQAKPAVRQDAPPAAAPRNGNPQAGSPNDPQRQQSPVNAPDNAAPPRAGAGVPIMPQAPFQLALAQERLVDQILLKWEKVSDKITSFKCSFDRWEIDKTFGPKEQNYIRSEAEGTIKYRSPDHGDYEVTALREWDPKKEAMVAVSEGREHWVCDGKAIYEFNAKQKQLIVRNLPSEMQGKAISDGPLPFIFGAKAVQLKIRYWIRDVTPRAKIGKEIWLEAWPKRQQDAANFHHVTVILTDPDFSLSALQIILPDGKNRSEYAFKKGVINDRLEWLKGDFKEPTTPFGWTKVVEPAPAQVEAAQAAGPSEPRQGQRAKPTPVRK